MSNIHIVGAGLSGLACAVRLAADDHQVFLYDSAGHAGGRCRSYFDSQLDCIIDNGNHLLLSGNTAVLDYLQTTGAEAELVGPAEAVFPFVDLLNDQRWSVAVDKGRWPGWLLDPQRRIPGTHMGDYFEALKLLFAGRGATLGDIVDTRKQLFRRFWEPFAVGVLNTPAVDGSAMLLAAVIRETFLKGGRHCMPRMAKTGLSETFVAPALSYLERNQVKFHPNTRLREITFSGDRATQLHFAGHRVDLAAEDTLVLAVPPYVCGTLVPDLQTPIETHAIVNGHFRIDRKINSPENAGLLGVIGGTAHWIFFRDDVISVTVSAADDLAERPAEEVAHLIWGDICRAVDGIDGDLPIRHRIVKEKRATFAQTPASIRNRPTARSKFANFYLAGDWTDTGLPATIEGSIRSGNLAAAAIKAAN